MFVLLVGLLIAPFLQAAPEFKENVNYEIIRQTNTPETRSDGFSRIIVPHCYQFKPIMAELKNSCLPMCHYRNARQLPSWVKIGPELQRAYAVTDLLKVEEKVTPVIFKRIQGNPATKMPCRCAGTVFEQAGVDGKDFDGAVDGFAVNRYGRAV